jgi:hypothetical protein
VGTDVRSPAMVKLDERIKENVLRGLDFLRTTYGEDWVDHINLETLQLSDSSSCVLGQVHPAYHGGTSSSGYHDAIDRYRETLGEHGTEHGFYVRNGWKRLQARWEKEIKNEKVRRDRKKLIKERS